MGAHILFELRGLDYAFVAVIYLHKLLEPMVLLNMAGGYGGGTRECWESAARAVGGRGGWGGGGGTEETTYTCTQNNPYG